MSTLLKYMACLQVFCSFFTILCAQEQYMFKRLETKDGLSHSQINYIHKDSKGFMWFGTAGGGLNRYDGYNYKVFRKIEKDSLSLLDNYINNIQEDIEGQLWLSTGAGDVVYDPNKEVFNRNTQEALNKMKI